MKKTRVLFTPASLNRIAHGPPTSDILVWTELASYAEQLLKLSGAPLAGR
jgi:hypothetical protein